MEDELTVQPMPAPRHSMLVALQPFLVDGVPSPARDINETVRRMQFTEEELQSVDLGSPPEVPSAAPPAPIIEPDADAKPLPDLFGVEDSQAIAGAALPSASNSLGSDASRVSGGSIVTDPSEAGSYVSTASAASSSTAAAAARLGAGAGAGESMHVYLRLRPISEAEARAAGGRDKVPKVMNLLADGKTVVTTAPETSAAYAHGDRSGTFSFTRVFGEEVAQEPLYAATALRPVQQAVWEGKCANIFAYGMTNAGKTFTITGAETNPGMLPRAISTVFSSVKALGTASSSSSAAAPTCPIPGMTNKLPPGTTASDVVVLVSYLEIYNDNCYDLLAAAGVAPLAGAAGGKPDGAAAAASSSSFSTSLRATGSIGMANFCLSGPANASTATGGRESLTIKEGRDGAYVKGLRQVVVRNPEAALAVMNDGKKNKAHAETALNADSSRSHTVFTISLFLKDKRLASTAAAASSSSAAAAVAGADAVLQEIVNPSTGAVAAGYIPWSRVAIVDLAGSERVARTGTTGLRVREAGNINLSLMCLMQCFEAMRHNQQAAAAAAAAKRQAVKRPVPFRDSKLTRLFADALGGASTGSTIMLVCAGPSPADFDETLQALKYGALVKEVKVQRDRVSTRWEPGQYDLNGRRNLPTVEGAGEGSEGANTKMAGLKRGRPTLAGAAAAVVAARKPSVAGAGGKAAAAAALSQASNLSAALANVADAVHAMPPPAKRSRLTPPEERRPGGLASHAEADETQDDEDDEEDGMGGGRASLSTLESGFVLNTAAVAAAFQAAAAGVMGGVEGSAAAAAHPAHEPASAAGTASRRSSTLGSTGAGLRAAAELARVRKSLTGASSSSSLAAWSDEKEALEDAIRCLSNQVAALEEQAEDAAAQADAVEAEVRAEAAEAMAARVTALETSWAAKLATLKEGYEARLRKLRDRSSVLLAQRGVMASELGDSEDEGEGEGASETSVLRAQLRETTATAKAWRDTAKQEQERANDAVKHCEALEAQVKELTEEKAFVEGRLEAAEAALAAARAEAAAASAAAASKVAALEAALTAARAEATAAAVPAPVPVAAAAAMEDDAPAPAAVEAIELMHDDDDDEEEAAAAAPRRNSSIDEANETAISWALAEFSDEEAAAAPKGGRGKAAAGKGAAAKAAKPAAAAAEKAAKAAAPRARSTGAKAKAGAAAAATEPDVTEAAAPTAAPARSKSAAPKAGGRRGRSSANSVPEQVEGESAVAEPAPLPVPAAKGGRRGRSKGASAGSTTEVAAAVAVVAPAMEEAPVPVPVRRLTRSEARASDAAAQAAAVASATGMQRQAAAVVADDEEDSENVAPAGAAIAAVPAVVLAAAPMPPAASSSAMADEEDEDDVPVAPVRQRAAGAAAVAGASSTALLAGRPAASKAAAASSSSSFVFSPESGAVISVPTGGYRRLHQPKPPLAPAASNAAAAAPKGAGLRGGLMGATSKVYKAGVPAAAAAAPAPRPAVSSSTGAAAAASSLLPSPGSARAAAAPHAARVGTSPSPLRSTAGSRLNATTSATTGSGAKPRPLAAAASPASSGIPVGRTRPAMAR